MWVSSQFCEKSKGSLVNSSQIVPCQSGADSLTIWEGSRKTENAPWRCEGSGETTSTVEGKVDDTVSVWERGSAWTALDGCFGGSLGAALGLPSAGTCCAPSERSPGTPSSSPSCSPWTTRRCVTTFGFS